MMKLFIRTGPRTVRSPAWDFRVAGGSWRRTPSQLGCSGDQASTASQALVFGIPAHMDASCCLSTPGAAAAAPLPPALEVLGVQSPETATRFLLHTPEVLPGQLLVLCWLAVHCWVILLSSLDLPADSLVCDGLMVSHAHPQGFSE